MSDKTPEHFNQLGAGHLPGLIGIKVKRIESLLAETELEIRGDLLAPNSYLHAGTVVTLADTTCGYGCLASLPEGAINFTTIELKSNFMGTARKGLLVCEARALHAGRTTQVWDASVFHRTDGHDKLIASFRCTQMILWPKA
ncbi:MAG: PaaI family thioesterase [Burkholderiaceae bacterium]|nr:PaaI family thioesterase [Burkholderiaceae bacterium]